MLDFSTIEAAVLKPVRDGKKSTGRHANFVGHRDDPRPIHKINSAKTLRRACQFDWLHESVFGKESIDDTIKRAQRTEGITKGYYFVTLTVDRTRSKLVSYEGKGLLIDKWWRDIKARVEMPASNAKKKGIEASVSPYCCQMDMDLAGWLHMHSLFVVRNEFEAETLRKTLAWWKDANGDADCQVVDSQIGVLKCLQYMFKPKTWHHNLPDNPQFKEVSQRRDLGFVSARNLPKVLEMRVVATQEATRKVVNFRCTVANGVPMLLPAAQPVARLSSLADVTCPEVEDALMKLTPQGPAAVLSAFLETVLTAVRDPGWQQVMINRLLDNGLTSSFVKIIYKGGWRRALRFLRKQVTFTNMKFAFSVTDTLRSFGKTCGIEIVNSLGEIRVIVDLDLAPIVGVRALSYEELRAKIDQRNVA
ncbi:MAG: hypothetical protein E6R03_08975 [Hyphomicrobiaceae bacterium]|nr:MAG: hypothetical protein E6R03_08975 [Hyphomicrobiaceae bacterium]